MDEHIVTHNLELMLSHGPGTMGSVDESIAGNAQTHNGHPCAAFTFFYDMQTGRILYFGLPQDAPERIRTEYTLGHFRVVTPVRAWAREMIIDMDAPFATTTARENLNESKERYNHAQRTA